MLVLSRKLNESILIGDDIEVKVLRVDRSGYVKLGISAPQDLRVDRKEVRELKDYKLPTEYLKHP